MESEYNPERDIAASLEGHKSYIQEFLEIRPEDKEKIEFVEISSLAFEDIDSESTYPNNKIEEYTFTRQFSYLKDRGIIQRKML